MEARQAPPHRLWSDSREEPRVSHDAAIGREKPVAARRRKNSTGRRSNADVAHEHIVHQFDDDLVV